MIIKRTVLVLGAGASKPYGFPLGRELYRLVRDIRDRPETIEILNALGHQEKRIYEFVHLVREADYSSIDFFLERYPEYKELGKDAIACILLGYESAEGLYQRDDDSHWYRLLADVLELSDIESLPESKLAVVTFNYERSLECYLAITARARCKNHTASVSEALKSIPIIHVYGSLGELNLDLPTESYNGVVTPVTVRDAAASIHIMNEASDDSHALREAVRHLDNAERIYFLGFGFHEVNVRRLRICAKPWDDERKAKQEVIATSQGMLDNEWKRVCGHTFLTEMPRHATDCLKTLRAFPLTRS